MGTTTPTSGLPPGFSAIEQLFCSDATVVWRALRERDGLTVIVKASHGEAGPLRAQGYRYEYDLLRDLSLDVSPKVLEFVEWGHHAALVFQPTPTYRPLRDRIAAGPLDLEFGLTVGSNLATALAAVHAKGVVHKDIKPGNVLVDTAGAVLLIDFAIASRVKREHIEAAPPSRLEGSLRYIAPEQTGRMNRVVDHRADLYALGATLYALFSGSPPFPNPDLSDAALVYAHIARRPAPLDVVPEAVDRIVQRLLAKNPDERYHSAGGVADDLRRCRDLLAQGELEPFQLGRADWSGALTVSDRLHGREGPLSQLYLAFDRALHGQARGLLVAGPSGIGKTALLDEVHRPLVERQGLFGRGKCAQFSRATPCLSVVEVLTELVEWALCAPHDVLAEYQARAVAAVGDSGSIIVELVPAACALLGDPAAPPPLEGVDARARFVAVLKAFLLSFSQPDHPLVVRLDDLQWADEPTFDLLRALLADPTPRALLVLGAYRDNEVGPKHGLTQLMADLTDSETPIEVVTLAPLSGPQIQNLLSATLRCPAKKVWSLATVLARLTGGNPFVLRQRIESLPESGLLWVDESGEWRWNLDGIAALPADDTVTQLLLSRFDRLSPMTTEALGVAAVVGGRFDLHTLAIALGRPPTEVAAALFAGIEAGFLMPIGHGYRLAASDGDSAVAQRAIYRFVHDRIHLAAMALLDGRRAPVHHRLATAMLAAEAAEPSTHRSHVIAGHIEACAERWGDADERARFAEVVERSASAACLANSWPRAQELHTLADQLRAAPMNAEEALARATTASMLDAHEAAATLAAAHMTTPGIPRRLAVRLHYRAAVSLCSVSRYDEALTVVVDGLKVLGIAFPRQPGRLRIVSALIKVKRALGRLDDAALEDQPRADDDTQLAVMLMSQGQIAAFLGARPNTFALLAFRGLGLMLTRGYTSSVGYSFILYGMLIQAALGDYAEGRRFAALGHRLNGSMAEISFSCKSLALDGLFLHFGQDLATTQQHNQEAVSLGFRERDPHFARYAFCVQVYTGIITGHPIKQTLRNAERLVETTEDFDFEIHVAARTYRHIVEDLSGVADRRDVLPEDLSEADYARCSPVSRAMPYLVQAFRFWVTEDKPHLSWALEAARPHLADVICSMPWALFFIMDAVLCADQLRDGKGGRRQASRARRAARRQGARWLKAGPECPWQGPLELAEAAFLEATGRHDAALALLEHSAGLCGRSGWHSLQGIAALRGARLARTLERRRSSQMFVGITLEAWRHWGVIGQVDRVCREFLISARPRVRSSGEFTTTTAHGGYLDLQALMESALVVSGERHPERLRRELMRIAVENSGARSASLLLGPPDALRLHASASLNDGEISVKLFDGDPPREDALPISVLQFVAQSQTTVNLADAHTEQRFVADVFLRNGGPRSVMCVPLMLQGVVSGVLYCENELTTSAFTERHARFLQFFAAQIAVCIENAGLFQQMQAQTIDLKVALQDARAASRAKAVFLENMSHELRTPLNGIIGIAELLESSDPDEAELLADLQASGELLLDTVESILRFASLASGDFALDEGHLDLKQVLTEVFGRYASTADEKGVTAQLSLDPQLPRTVIGDASHLKIAIGNLLDNAVRFTEFGHIKMDCRFVPGANGPLLAITIEDTGCGMSPTQLRDVFASFEQGDASSSKAASGVGLGVSISRRIARLMNGDLVARSVPGEGSTFTLKVGLGAAEDTPSLEEAVTRAPIGRRGDGAVLVVEDNPINQRIVQRLVERSGRRTELANDGQEAVDRYLAKPLGFSCVIMDCQMPVLDGYAATRAIRQFELERALPPVPIVALTANALPTDREKCLAAGMDAYLTKPVRPDVLHSALDEHIKGEGLTVRMESPVGLAASAR